MKARGSTSVGGIDGTFGGSLLFLTIARPLLSILAGGGIHIKIVLYSFRVRNFIQGNDDDDDDDDENDEGKAHTEHQNVSSLLEALVPTGHLCPPGNFFSLC